MMFNFAEQLKKLRRINNLRQQDLADQLGVAQTTIANYERGYRFPSPDLLIQIADYFAVSLDDLLGRDLLAHEIEKTELLQELDYSKSEDCLPEIIKKYVALLLAGKKKQALSILIKLYQDLGMEKLCLDVLSKGLEYVDYKWQQDEADLSEEHYIAELTKSFLSYLRFSSKRRIENNSRAVLLTVNGEMHDLALRIFEVFLEKRGWQTFYIGNYLPHKKIINMLSKKQADLVVISVAMAGNFNLLQNLIAVIKTEFKNPPKIIVGGYLFNTNPDLYPESGADFYAADIYQGIEWAEGIKD